MTYKLAIPILLALMVGVITPYAYANLIELEPVLPICEPSPTQDLSGLLLADIIERLWLLENDEQWEIQDKRLTTLENTDDMLPLEARVISLEQTESPTPQIDVEFVTEGVIEVDISNLPVTYKAKHEGIHTALYMYKNGKLIYQHHFYPTVSDDGTTFVDFHYYGYLKNYSDMYLEIHIPGNAPINYQIYPTQE